MNPKFFLGPMSKNIVDTAIEYCNKNNTTIGLIPSRRQIDYNGGYVNGWNTKTFSEYVRNRTKNILLVRDHCGPNQGQFEDDGIESFIEDCKYFDVIHVDVWKQNKEYHDGLLSTIKFIKLGYSLNPDIYFEVGTEQSIREFSVNELRTYLNDLKKNLSKEEFGAIKYVVIQSGTALKENKNIGLYDKEKLTQMIGLVSEFNLISKEHNGDYLESYLIEEKFNLGLNCINIAPELGQIETSVILEKISNNEELCNKFYEICFLSNKWKKWVDSDFVPQDNKLKLINIAGHYVFSDYEFIELKKKLSNIDEQITNSLNLRMETYSEIENKSRINTLQQYFRLFSEKDIHNLSKLFHPDVKLIDWEITANGIDEVISSNEKIFSSVKSFKVNVLKIISDGLVYCCEIQITIDNTDKIDVIDMIEFDNHGKILSIRAYKG